jgi:endonuclease/exonuclease/phosphatase family metal-dependent hydrolase
MVRASRPLTVMTFNLRYAHPRPPDLWRDRRPVASRLIERWAPDVVGTQEGLYQQLVDLEEDLPDYRWIGLGREGGSHGEFMAVFYRPDRLTSLEFDHFWLSDRPREIGSRSWGNEVRRMVTWVRFRDEAAGTQFYFVNTHLDHESSHSRRCSAEMIARWSREVDPSLPVVLAGDFNADGGDSVVHDLLTGQGGFSDSWHQVGNREPDHGTYHAFEGLPGARDRPRIDWILVRGAVRTLATRIVTDSEGGQFPSDHFPVVARLAIGGR